MSNQNEKQSDEVVPNNTDCGEHSAMEHEIHNADNPLAAEQAAEADNVDSIETLQQALLDANAKAEENWALFLSARAEADNIRKRAERDIGNAHKYALEKFIPELLKVKDSLELGTKAARENSEVDNEQLAKFLEGSDMTITLFNDVLAKADVVMIDPQGEVFNPEFHQAMTLVPNPDLPANTVIDVVQKGYTLNERLLRPAMVIVSKAD